MAQQVPANMALRYRALATPWRPSSATNVYGTTGGWVSGINTGVGVAEGYSRAIQRLLNYGAALGNIPADQLDRIKTSYATVELTDGANQHAIETVGRLRANAAQVEQTVQGLEEDSLSADPAMNTESQSSTKSTRPMSSPFAAPRTRTSCWSPWRKDRWLTPSASETPRRKPSTTTSALWPKAKP